MSTSVPNGHINKLTSAARVSTVPSSSASSSAAIDSKTNDISDEKFSTSTANGINSERIPIYTSAVNNQTLSNSAIDAPSTSVASPIKPSTHVSRTLLTVPVNALQSLRKHKDWQKTAAANRDRVANSPGKVTPSSPKKCDPSMAKVESVKLLLRLRGLNLYKNSVQSQEEEEVLDSNSPSGISKEDGEISDKGHLSAEEDTDSGNEGPNDLSDGEIVTEGKPLLENGMKLSNQRTLSTLGNVSLQQLPAKESPMKHITTSKHSLPKEEELISKQRRIQTPDLDEGPSAKNHDKFPPPPVLVPASALSRHGLTESIAPPSNQGPCPKNQDEVPAPPVLVPSSALVHVKQQTSLVGSSSSTPKPDSEPHGMSCSLCEKLCHVRNMIVCKLCSIPTHLYCLSPPRSEPPCFPWKCAKCIRQRALLSQTVHASTQTDDRVSIYISDDNRAWLPLKLRNKPHLAADLPLKPNHRSLPDPAAVPRPRYVHPIALSNGAVVPVQYTGEAALSIFGAQPPANVANVLSCEYCGTFHSGEIAGDRFCSFRCARLVGAIFPVRGRGGRGRGRGRGRGTRGRGSRKRGGLLATGVSQRRYAIRGIGGLETLAQVARAAGSDNSGGYTDSSDGENQNEGKDVSGLTGATMDRRLTRGRKEAWEVGYEPDASTSMAAGASSDLRRAQLAATQSGTGPTTNGSTLPDGDAGGRTSSKSKTKYPPVDPAVAAIPIGQPGHIPAGKSGVKPGKGFKFCHVCFELVANRRFICQHCNTPNPSSRRTAANPAVVDSFGKPIVKKRRIPESPLDGLVSIKKKRKNQPSSVGSSAVFAASATGLMINAPSFNPSSASNKQSMMNIPKLKALSIATNTTQDSSSSPQPRDNLTAGAGSSAGATASQLPAKIVVKKTPAKKSSVMGMLNPQGFYGQGVLSSGPVYRGLPNGVMQDQARKGNLSTILNGHSPAPSHGQSELLQNPPRLPMPMNPLYDSRPGPPARPRSSEPRFRVIPRTVAGQLRKKGPAEEPSSSMPERSASVPDIGPKPNRKEINEPPTKNGRSLLSAVREQEYRPIVVNALVQNSGQESGRGEGE